MAGSGGTDGGLDAISLLELPQPFSTAPPSQLAFAGLLGAANLAGVLYIGRLLSSVAGVPTAYLGSAGPMIGLLRRIYAPLLAYATGFVALPAIRAVRNRRLNAAIDERNGRRADWSAAIDVTSSSSYLSAGDVPMADVESAAGLPNMEAGLPNMEAGRRRGGLRASLRRKLQAARALAPKLRRFRRGGGAAYSTAQDLASQVDVSSGGEAAGLEGAGFDDFDRRLRDSDPSALLPPPSPPPPSPPPPAPPPPSP